MFEVAANLGVDSGLDIELETNPRPAFGGKKTRSQIPKSEELGRQDSSHCVERTVFFAAGGSSAASGTELSATSGTFA